MLFTFVIFFFTLIRVRFENEVEKLEVSFKNVSLTYDKGPEIIHDMSFVIPDGKLVALLGPSGGGKSTILNLISGLLPATKGEIYFDTENVTDKDALERGVGMVFQNYALYPHMTVLDNIIFPMKMMKIDKETRTKKAKELAKLVRVEDQIDKKPGELSGGQQQRVAIARALAKTPKILLLDEPLSNLDARLRVEMREEIRRIQQETGITTVFVTHDQSEAMHIADKIMILQDGKIQQFDTPSNLYNHPANLLVAKFIGDPVINEVKIDSIKKYLKLPKDAAYIAIRPEAIKVATGKDTKIPVYVESVVSFGKDRVTRVKLDDSEMVVTNDLSAKENASAHIAIDKEGFFVFDKDGKKIEANL